MSEAEMREWIEGASYEKLLERSRNAPIGSPWFEGDIGDYYAAVMKTRRSLITNEEHVQASKNIGWEY